MAFILLKLSGELFVADASVSLRYVQINLFSSSIAFIRAIDNFGV